MNIYLITSSRMRTDVMQSSIFLLLYASQYISCLPITDIDCIVITSMQ